MTEKKALERKYAALYTPVYTQRAEIVSGRVDVDDDGKPDEEAVGAVGGGEGGVEAAAGAEGSGGAGGAKAKPSSDDIVGIPNFWCQAMCNHEVLAQLVTERDEEALAYLQDVRVEDYNDQQGFRLVFHFGPNPFFTNSELSKTYGIPNMYAGVEPELAEATGTEIHWKKGRNLTVRLVKRQQRRGRKGPRVVTKQEPADSFFRFFNSPSLDGEGSDSEADEEELYNQIDADFEIALTFREKLVPNAYLWFTGEAVDMDSDDDDDELDEEEEERFARKGRVTGADEDDGSDSGADNAVDPDEVRAALARAFKERGGKLPAGVGAPPSLETGDKPAVGGEAATPAGAANPSRPATAPAGGRPPATATAVESEAPPGHVDDADEAGAVATGNAEGVVEKPGECQQQ